MDTQTVSFCYIVIYVSRLLFHLIQFEINHIKVETLWLSIYRASAIIQA